MTRHSALLVVSLLLSGGRSFAREPQAPPSPAGDGPSTSAGGIKTVPNPSGYGARSLFIGRYGEAIEIPHNWAADVESRGQAEVVYFHRKYSDDHNRVRFQPKPEQYKPADFSRLELMELLVIPKSAPGGLRSLAALRRAKEAELARSGVGSKITDEKNAYAWPSGTFYMETLSPYRLLQTYSESPGEFYILTVGRGAAVPRDLGEKRASDYDYAADRAQASLRTHLLAGMKPSGGEMSSGGLFVPAPGLSQDFFSSFKATRFIALFGALAAAMLVLAFWPGTAPRSRRARFLGRSLFLFSHLTASAGFISSYAPILLAGHKWRSFEDASLLPVMLIPLICGLAARRLGGAHVRRVSISTGVIAGLWTLLVIMTRGPGDRLPAEFGVFGNTVTLYLVGMALGTAFTLFFGPLPKAEETR